MAQLKRKGPNKYLISVYLGRDANGKKIYHYEAFNGTLSQARLRAAELEAQLKKRAGPAKLSMTVGQYLDTWLEKIRGTISGRTWETYFWRTRRLKEILGNLPMYNLTAFTLQEALAGLHGKVKPRTLKDMYSTLRTALRQAVAWGLLSSDPTAGLRAPRVPREERRVLTVQELKKLLEAAKGYKHYLIIRLLALTGMRLGEVLGLKWQDIDLEKGTLTVRRAADVRHRKLKETKTSSSERTLLLDAETVALLKAHRKASGKVQSLAVKRSDLVFASLDGRPVKESAVRKTLNRALAKADLPHIRIHDLRHTAGSLLLDAGYSFPTVAAFLGHSSPATTAAVYAHAVRKSVSVAAILKEKEADQKTDRDKKTC